MDVAAWLRGLGLEQYAPAFRDNDIDGTVLPSLTAEDLKDLGISSIGHRRRLLEAISAIREGGSPAVIGIATGLVVVGDLIGAGAAQEQAVVGETPNLAARLQSLAQQGALLVDANTRRLVGDLFEFHDLGAVEVKGFARAVLAWQVLRQSTVASRFEALRASSLTALVGREEEIEFLLRRWARAKEGHGQVVLVSGEPGIGKSRIAVALADRLRDEPSLRLRYFCTPYYENSPLRAPRIPWLTGWR
jgi:hypothetical protein